MENCFYHLKELPTEIFRVGKPAPNMPMEGPKDKIKWSGDIWPIPAIGTRVKANINGLGWGTVAEYFTEYNWLGVYVKLENRPQWHREQNPDRDYCMVFGLEISLE